MGLCFTPELTPRPQSEGGCIGDAARPSQWLSKCKASAQMRKGQTQSFWVPDERAGLRRTTVAQHAGLRCTRARGATRSEHAQGQRWAAALAGPPVPSSGRRHRRRRPGAAGLLLHSSSPTRGRSGRQSPHTGRQRRRPAHVSQAQAARHCG